MNTARVRTERIPIEELKLAQYAIICQGSVFVRTERIPIEELKLTGVKRGETQSRGPNRKNSDRGIETRRMMGGSSVSAGPNRKNSDRGIETRSKHDADEVALRSEPKEFRSRN